MDNALRQWLYVANAKLAHDKYTTLMESLGKTPFSFSRFLSKKAGNSAYIRFQRLERGGIQIDMPVTVREKLAKTYRIASIAPDCFVHLHGYPGGGAFDPSALQLVVNA